MLEQLLLSSSFLFLSTLIGDSNLELAVVKGFSLKVFFFVIVSGFTDFFL